MDHFTVPYAAIMGPEGYDRNCKEVVVTMTVYYFIYDGRLLTETVRFSCLENKLDNHSYTRRRLMWNAVGAGSERMKRFRNSNKVLFHYTEPDRWACVKDRKTGSDALDYEMTDKEKTFLALAAESV